MWRPGALSSPARSVSDPCGRVRIFLILTATLLLGVSLLVVLAVRRAAEGERLAGLLELGPSSTIAEIGAGTGWLSVEIANRLGEGGRMYSTELNPARLDDIRQAVADAGLTNVTVIEAGERATNLPRACCDAIFMRRVYHHISEPQEINASLYEAIRPGGRLIIIEFNNRGWLGTITRMGIERGTLAEAVTFAGFELIAIEEWPGLEHYVAVFRRPGLPPPARSTDRPSGFRSDDGVGRQADGAEMPHDVFGGSLIRALGLKLDLHVVL